MRSRLALLAVLALAGLVLSACQRDPSVAAAVGSDKITEDQVDAILADVQRNRPAPQATPDNPTPTLGPVAINRGDVVRYLVLDKMCAADQARRHFPSGEPLDVASVKKISPDSQFAKMVNRMTACLNGEVSTAAEVTPTDDELRDIYDRAVKLGLTVPAFDAFKDQLKASDAIKQRLSIKRAIEDQAKVQNVSVSPRYRPLELGLAQVNANESETGNEALPFEGQQVIVATLGQPTDAIQPF